MQSSPFSRRQRLVAWGVGVLTGLASGVALQALVGLEQERRRGAEQLALQAKTASVRAHLESELNASLSMSLGLSSFVLSRPDFGQRDFEQVAASLIRAQPAIRSIGLAPDNVIRFIYPLAGNRRALGLDYLKMPAQRDAVLRMVREQRPVVAGPVDLVQGGLGIVNRIPIVFHDEAGATRYWGLASVVVDPAPIFRRAGLLDAGMHYALRGRDGLGARGAGILGDPALFADPRAVRMEVVIPGGSWQLAARPAAVAQSGFGRIEFAIALVALAIGALAASAVRGHQRVRNLALTDSLTGLANRRQFLLRAEQILALARRSGRPVALLNLDIDGFKRINDSHGHAAGDLVLSEVGRRMRATFRQSDLIARIGGDEFLALLPDTPADARLDTLVARLRDGVVVQLPGASAPEPIRLSVGVASLGSDAVSLEALMREADHAMYAVKKQRHPAEPGRKKSDP